MFIVKPSLPVCVYCYNISNNTQQNIFLIQAVITSGHCESVIKRIKKFQFSERNKKSKKKHKALKNLRNAP